MHTQTYNQSEISQENLQMYRQQRTSSLTQRNYLIIGNEQVPLSNSSQEHVVPFSDKVSGSIRQAHIISSCKKAPEGYVCVGRLIEPAAKTQAISPAKSGIIFLNEDANTSRKELGPSFSSKKIQKMPSKEKVNKWIENIPFRIVDNVVFQECYPGIPLSDSEEATHIFFDTDDDIFEEQCRTITKYTTRMYSEEDEPVAWHEKLSAESIEASLWVAYEDQEIDYDNSFDSYFQLKKQNTLDYIINTTI